ncbi:hypothetical protein DRA43_16930, partial [Micromonospora provocatoris]
PKPSLPWPCSASAATDPNYPAHEHPTHTSVTRPEFLASRSYPGKENDDRAKILQVMTSGGPAVDAAASKALDGTDADRHAFLTRGQYEAAAHDERAEILRILSADPKPGPEVTSAAKIALAGPESWMRGFLRAGHEQAKDRDWLLATHQARVDAAVAQAAQAAAAAQQVAYEAAQAAAVARNAADEAAGYANQAAESARQATIYANQARDSANQAKASAQKAAESAATARNAAAAAKADARRADQSAADARYSAYRAKQHADAARQSADEARQSALAAKKSAAEAQADYDKAYDIALDLIDAEEQSRRDNPPTKDPKKCDRPPGYGADPSCYPSLPGLERGPEDGEILCWSWAENQKQCGYTIVTPEERRQFEQDRENQKTLNACALLIPGCFNALTTVMALDPSTRQDPEVMLELAVMRLLGNKMTAAARRSWLINKLACRKNSFSADTRVVMADGRTKPISQVRLRDRVRATDPVSGRTSGREVVALHRNQDMTLTDVRIREANGALATVHTTQEHPFWDATRGAWVDAARLGTGDRLYTAAGSGPTVARVTSFTGNQLMYNLSVASVQTYYIVAGRTQVLVHNAPPTPQTCDLAGVEVRHPGQAHTLSDHVNVTPARAQQLANSEKAIHGVWQSEEVATRAIDQLIAKKLTPKKLQEWFRTYNQNGRPNLELKGPVAPAGTSLGKVYRKDLPPTDSSNEIIVVLKRDKSEPGGYYVFTAYPLP